MSFNPLVANAGRLRILTALAVQERQEFVALRRRTQLSDGNLAAHAKRLQSGGMIDIDKQFRDGKPVTSFALTQAGRQALEAHVRRLMAALSHRRLESQDTETSDAAVSPPPASLSAASAQSDHVEDDWVD